MNISGLEHRLAAVVEEAYRGSRIPGLSVAVSVGGERAAVSFGTTAAGSGIPMTPGARFQLGCITKVLTCIAAMQLAHTGKIDPEGTIGEYLPELAEALQARDIRIRHLGAHTSGYRGLHPARPEYGYFYSWPKFVNFFRSTDQVFRPGSVFNYEHTESVILGEVIKRVSGSSTETLVRDLILEPLQVTTGSIERDAGHPEVRVADHSLDQSSGQYATVRSVPYCSFWAPSLSSMTMGMVDLVTLGEMLSGLRLTPGISAGALDAVVRQVVQLPRSAGGPQREVLPRSFGFGCAQYGPGVFGHNGSARGQTCGLRFSPAAGVVVAVALNCWDPYARDSLLQSLLQILLPDFPAESGASGGPPKVDMGMDELEGMYAGCVEGLQIEVRRNGDRLLCSLDGLSGSGTQKLNLEVAFDAAGELRAKCPLRHLSVAFFREEHTGTPAILVALNAFRKVRAA